MKKFAFCIILLFHFIFSFSQTKYYYNYCLGINGPFWVTAEKDSSNFYAFVDLDTLTFGEILFFYKSGELFAKDFYDKQKLAESKHYYKNGKKKYVLSKEYNSTALDVSSDLMKVHNISSNLKMKNMWDSLGKKIDPDKPFYLIDYYPNGNRMREGKYMNGFADSTWKGYYENGHLMYQGYYSGQHRAWRFDFILSSRGDTLVKNGRGKFIITYENNRPSYVGEYISGHLTDQLKTYYPNGQLRYSVYYSNGRYQGKYESFYSNGMMKSVGNYVSGGKKGEWTWYNKQGKVVKFKKFEFLNYEYGDL
jgi:antitoxin component YwqK of YwqJK toxin-antitoxin module